LTNTALEFREPITLLRPSVGERNSSAVLTTDKVRAIRAAADAGGNVRLIGAAFGISERAARHIARRTSWTHVAE